MQKSMRVQFGYELKTSPTAKPTIRLTPIDEMIPGIPDEAVGLLAIAFAAADARDSQPGDGDIDIPLTDSVMKLLRERIPVINVFLPRSGGNAFVRVTFP